MASSPQKPLPAIPLRPAHSQPLTTLTVDAQSHLSTFIRHVLSETDGHLFPDGGIEPWAQALESGLAELGESISRGGWLTGLKRGRKAQKLRREARQAESVKEKAKIKKEQEDLGKGKSKKKGAQDEPLERQDAGTRGLFAKMQSPQSLHADSGLALNQIRELVGRPMVPTPKPSAKHMLLSVVPFGSRIALPKEDSGFDLIPTSVGCVFTSGVFSLPDAHPPESVFLYGLDEWDVDAYTEDEDAVRLIGGSFSFKGVTSPTQHSILFKALRISIYMSLSLLLEQHFLANSNVQLKFPKPKQTKVSSADVSFKPSSGKPRPSTPIRHAFSPTGLFSFFSKKTGNLLHRTHTISPILGGRGGSLDLTENPSPTRSSEDNGGFRRLRRFSFISESPSTTKPKDEADSTFSYAVARIEKCKGLLSTSIGVAFSPPPLIVALAEKEKNDPSRRLKGDEKAGLTSILGWDGKETRAKGMVGTAGFVRQQEFSILYSEHVASALPLPPTSIPTLPLSSPDPSPSSSLSSSLDPPPPILSPCGRARWITFRYYSRYQGADKMLGEIIEELCDGIGKPCETPKCQFKRLDHQIRFIHAGVRIVVDVDIDNQAEKGNTDGIDVWESCKVCRERTEKSQMSDGTYLFSFAKFLELLVYSPTICTITPSLCEHTTPPQQPWPPSDSPLPRSRLNIMRHFGFHGRTVSFGLSIIEDIFELRVPRLQMLRWSVMEKERSLDCSSVCSEPTLSSSMSSDTSISQQQSGEGKRILRREIKSWWEGVADHMDKLEDIFMGNNLEALRKSLPRLPSVDDAYEIDDMSITPKPTVSALPPLRPDSTSPGPQEKFFQGVNNALENPGTADPKNASPSVTPRPPQPSSPQATDPVKLLSSMRHTFQLVEQSLYSQLSRASDSALNDVRRSFLSAARGASRRLGAWQDKHLPHKARSEFRVEKLSVREPEWWNKSCHVVPGGNIIVREDDWGSIIAFTLSSSEYVNELMNMVCARHPPGSQSAPLPSPAVTTTSFFSTSSPYKLFGSSSHHLPDPDQEDVIWHEPESYSAVVTRKENPRDPALLLSFRDVLRQKSSVEGSSGLPASVFSTFSGSASRNASGLPPSAWAKPAVEVSKAAVDGEVSGSSEAGVAAGKLHEVEAISAEHVTRPPSSTSTSSIAFESNIRRGKASSIISVASDTTIGPEGGSISSLPPIPPPKDGDDSSASSILGADAEANTTPSTFANSLSSTLGNAVRYMLNSGETNSPPTLSKNHHGLLSTTAIDERPHIKHDWTIGKRLKFSCTAYYAKQFDALRRRCGIDDVFLKSLGRSANWAAEGGKSKSNFWKTSDDRFIIKTLVNAWNVADLQVLIELAPSYFRYMEATTSKPTVLAKLLGFYTVEIKNLENGNIQAKADLLVMENLFYDQKIAKTFDLKGIQGRKVKAGTSGNSSSKSSKTLFDGEWIEGQQRTLMLVHPHSKIVLREAIKSDSDFLSKSNIMDYSLLLGVDMERKEIACGLVDTIGSYTFAKTLEYKAKQGLNSGKDTTVIPPTEYQERFISALDGYFLACPDKWSRPLDDPKGISDPSLLPGVL